MYYANVLKSLMFGGAVASPTDARRRTHAGRRGSGVQASTRFEP